MDFISDGMPLSVFGYSSRPDGYSMMSCEAIGIGSADHDIELARLMSEGANLFSVDAAALPPLDLFVYNVPEAADKGGSARTATITVDFVGMPAEAQSAFRYAADIWETLLDAQQEIVVEARWETLASGILGSAGPTGFYSDNSFPTSNYYPIALANEFTGRDYNDDSAEIRIRFNSLYASQWYMGTDGATPSGKIDFVSVVLHEIGHGLGFVDSFDYDDGQGTGECDNISGSGCRSTPPFIYDTFVRTGQGRQLTSGFSNPSASLGFALTSDNLNFAGSAAASAHGGGVPVFAPTDWQSGSSIAHLDEQSFPGGGANALMTPTLGSAEANHWPGAVGCGVFSDIGWTMSGNCEGSVGSEDLIITNSGGADLIISSISDGASWLTLSGVNTPHTLSPGQSVSLSASVNWSQVSTPSSSTTIDISSNDPDKSTVSVPVVAQRNSTPPSVSVTQPSSAQTVTPGQVVAIGWNGSPSSGASVSLYLDTNTAWNGGSGTTQIVSGRPATGSYDWDTNSLSDGTYYIVAVIYDGSSTSYDYSPPITLSTSQDEVAVDIADAMCAPSESILVPIQVSDLTGKSISGFQFQVSFDSSVIDLTSAEASGTLSQGKFVSSNQISPGVLNVAVAGTSPYSSSGTLLELAGTCQENPGASSVLSFSSFQFDNQSVFANTTSGTVAIRDVLCGDATDDGQVDVSDAVESLRYIVQLRSSLPCDECADVDGSGIVDVADAVLILRYIVQIIDGFPECGAGDGAGLSLAKSGDLERSDSALTYEIQSSGTRGSRLIITANESDLISGFDLKVRSRTTLTSVRTEMADLASKGWLIMTNETGPNEFRLSAAGVRQLQAGDLVAIELESAGPMSELEVQIRDDRGISSVRADDTLPSEMGLELYPNPFAERTTVEIELPEAGLAELALFDAMGRIVRTELLPDTGSGRSRFVLESNGLSAGTYFLRLSQNGFTLTRPTVISR